MSQTDPRTERDPLLDDGSLAGLLFEANPQPAWIFEAVTLRFLAVNPAASRTYGYPPDEFLGISLRDVYVPEDLDALLAQVWRATEGPPGLQLMTARHRRKDGARLDVEVAWSRIVYDGRGAILSVITDFTAQRLAEAALWQSEDLLHTVVNSSPIALWATDRDLRVTLSEGLGLASLGLRPGEMVGRTIPELYPEQGEVVDLHRRALAGEHFAVTVDLGELRWEAHYSPIRTEGEIVGVFGVATDITARDRAQRALDDALQFNSEIVSNAAEGIVVVDLDLRYRVWNRAMEEISGLSAAQVLGQRALDLFPHMREHGVDLMVGRALKGETVASPDIHYHVPQSGRSGWISARYSPHRDAQGRIQGVVGLVREISDRRRVEEALRASEARHRTLVESVSDALISIDESGDIAFVNRAAEELFGYPAAELHGRPYTMLLPEAARARHESGLRAYVQDGTPYLPWEGTEPAGLRQDGTEFPIEVSFGEFRTDEGRQFVGVVRDLTERRRATEALRESEQKFRTITNTLPCAVHIYQDGRFPFANQALTAITGYTQSELEQVGFWEVIHPDSHADVQLRMAERLAGRPVPLRYEVRIVRKDGQARWLDLSDEIIEYEGHRAALCTAFDVTDRKQADLLDRDRSKVIEMVATNQPLAEILRELVELVERQRPEMIASLLMMRDGRLYQGAAPRMPEAVTLAIAEGIPPGPAAGSCGTAAFRAQRVVSQDIEHDHIWKDYAALALANGLRAAWSVPILSAQHEVLGTFALYYREPRRPTPADLTLLDVASGLATIAIEQRELTDRLAHQAHHDALTGLPNRVLFEDRLAMAIAHAHRQQRQAAVLFLDLDQFKVINDSLGHALGDKLLQAVAARLQSAVREGDTVARQGGDEFILLLPFIPSAVDAAKVARKVLEAVRQPFRLDGHDLYITTSIGVSVYPEDGDTVEALIKNSDSALYRAKERGRDGVQLYAPAMNAQAAERLNLESSLRRALPLGQFELFYQPVVDSRTGAAVGVEALLRWRHPDRGLLAPGEFINLAEITGLISQIGPWALRTACGQARHWHEHGHEGLMLSVNVSPRQFLEGDLVGQVAAALDESGLDPSLLELEITESLAMQHAEATIGTLRRLKALGVRVAIDDFGTGYSSLAYLKRFPLDTLKIDRSFVHDIHNDPVAAAISTAVIVMAHTLKLRVVAEGVESDEQREFLSVNGCDSMQGYLFGRPVPAVTCESLLRAPGSLPGS